MLMPAPQTLAKKLNKDVFSLLEEGGKESGGEWERERDNDLGERQRAQRSQSSAGQ